MRFVFSIAPGPSRGVAFAGSPAEAMRIVENARGGPTIEPTGPYVGAQFGGFALAASRKRLEVLNANDDGRTYRYSLWFTVPARLGEVDGPGPVFAEFGAPGVSDSNGAAVDKGDDQNDDEFSIAFVAPGGGTMVMDPKIQNGTKPP
ncbi:MAG: hypothetical protein HXY21_06785 [Parvularculaceae bacterium]|nr:hypothetical protein [Parvularculaceae bacterium]